MLPSGMPLPSSSMSTKRYMTGGPTVTATVLRGWTSILGKSVVMTPTLPFQFSSPRSTVRCSFDVAALPSRPLSSSVNSSSAGLRAPYRMMTRPKLTRSSSTWLISDRSGARPKAARREEHVLAAKAFDGETAPEGAADADGVEPGVSECSRPVRSPTRRTHSSKLPLLRLGDERNADGRLAHAEERDLDELTGLVPQRHALGEGDIEQLLHAGHRPHAAHHAVGRQVDGRIDQSLLEGCDHGSASLRGRNGRLVLAAVEFVERIDGGDVAPGRPPRSGRSPRSPAARTRRSGTCPCGRSDAAGVPRAWRGSCARPPPWRTVSSWHESHSRTRRPLVRRQVHLILHVEAVAGRADVGAHGAGQAALAQFLPQLAVVATSRAGWAVRSRRIPDARGSAATSRSSRG